MAAKQYPLLDSDMRSIVQIEYKRVFTLRNDSNERKFSLKVTLITQMESWRHRKNLLANPWQSISSGPALALVMHLYCFSVLCFLSNRFAIEIVVAIQSKPNAMQYY